MEFIFSIVTSFVLATSGFVGANEDTQTSAGPRSVEIGLAELSPAGQAGGYAMPASGCSDANWHGEGIHDCNQRPTITTDNPIIRSGDDAIIRWNPNGIPDCVVLGAQTNVGVVTTRGNVTVSPTSDTTYSIICASDPEFSDTVTVRVLPRIQET